MRPARRFDQIVKGSRRESLGARTVSATASGRRRYPGPRRNRLRAIDVSFEGTALRVIGQEDFIAMKAFAGGPQDLVDAVNAVGIAGESLDVDLVKRLAKRYGREAVSNLEKILGENK